MNHVETTLVLDDTVVQRLREEAAKRGVIMTEHVEAGLRRVADEPMGPQEPLPELRRWNGGARRAARAPRAGLNGGFVVDTPNASGNLHRDM